MTAQIATITRTKTEPNQEIPKYLIYETLDGIPVYYRGYKEVLNQNKKSADIKSYGGLQWYLLTILSYYLKQKIDPIYFPLVGEGGIHLEKNSNLSLDLAIFLKKEITFDKLKNKYFDIAPRIVIEVDTKADSEMLQQMNYYNIKTKKLLDFGVEKVLWIYTETEQVMIAVKDKPWLTVNWTDEVEVLGQTFTIQQVIMEAEKN